MAISNSSENLDHQSNPQQHDDSDLNPSLRRRPNSNAVKTVPDSFSKTNTTETGNLNDFATDSGADTSSNEDRDQVGNGGDRKEKADLLSNGEDCGERIGNGEGRGPETDAPVKFAFRTSTPAHRRVKESPLSSDAIFKQSHAGLFNLCIVVLVAVNSRLIIENLMKYGLLIRSGFWFSSKSLRDWPLLMCCLTLPIFPLGAFMVEKLAQQKRICEPVVVLLHVIITTAAILYPVFVILRCDSAVQSGVILMLSASIVWLKLVSYAHTNYDMRALAKSVCKADIMFTSLHVEYSYDGSFKSLAYFMVAPTLCYQPSYPHTACIRKGWVIRQLVKLIIFTGVMGFIIEQYINPIVQNSQHPLRGNLLYAIERVLKLSVPTLYVWLCMFYCLFHLWLNILAELLCFGDREFYKDWWNAKTIEEAVLENVEHDAKKVRNHAPGLKILPYQFETCALINQKKPVHKWMVRHIYIPCLQNGLPKGIAVVIAFFVSAIFHELCIAVPCHIFKFWAFIGIMFQVPLVIFTNYLQNKFKNNMVGNMIFWFFFSILGQPMCLLLYYHDLMNQKVRTE
ncbi:hypothetical protein HHK36_021840 [Tetracentron sinense]|uniref:O-acyltransferase n=1 Tax=Tetracentron sinense TaxID=13715 RepID=A0A834YVZ7_TETSI|nr:hypothetical protein HHK36_021840 [Tetracentron sinense]